MELSKEFIDSLTKEEREFILSWKELHENYEFKNKLKQLRSEKNLFHSEPEVTKSGALISSIEILTNKRVS